MDWKCNFSWIPLGQVLTVIVSTISKPENNSVSFEHNISCIELKLGDNFKTIKMLKNITIVMGVWWIYIPFERTNSNMCLYGHFVSFATRNSLILFTEKRTGIMGKKAFYGHLQNCNKFFKFTWGKFDIVGINLIPKITISRFAMYIVDVFGEAETMDFYVC